MGREITKPCGSLALQALQLLQDRPRWLTYERIEADLIEAKCNAINVFWLTCFVRGTIKMPDVDRVQTLYEYLAKKELQL